MSKYNQFTQDEIKIDLDNMQIYRIEKQELSHDEVASNIKKVEELFKDKKTELGFDAYSGPSPADLEGYYSFWRIKLLYLIDASILNRIEEGKFDEAVIHNELGITKEELLKPNPMVVEKAKQYLSVSKKSMKR